MPGGQFLELLLLKWSDFDNSKIAAGHFTHNYGLDQWMWQKYMVFVNPSRKETVRFITTIFIKNFN